MTNQKQYPDLGSDASSGGITAFVSETSFGGETSGSVAKCQQFSQAITKPVRIFCPIFCGPDRAQRATPFLSF